MAETLGDRLRLARKRQAMQQKDLARRVGISASGLSQIERNHVDPKSLHLQCLAQVLGISSDYLLGLTEAPRPLMPSCRTVAAHPWYEPVVQRLAALVALSPGWDGYQAVPVAFANACFTLAVLDACCRDTDPLPQLVPGPSGTLQIEWHLARGDIELHIMAPQQVEAWYAEAAPGGKSVTVALTTDFSIVTRWLAALTAP